MDLGSILLRLLAVLIAARVAAEIAERAGQPAVLLEILTGILIGPSALGLVGDDEFLRILGELGAILLLFEVGLQMDLRALLGVGADALRVAAIGVIVPMALSFPALRLLGVNNEVAIFLAAAITATSVGITARVFGDLRALASGEARTVLGAAVADDVAGLLVLTVVVRLVSVGGLDLGGVAAVVTVALAFVVGASVAGVAIAPRLFEVIARRARTDGTLAVLALALALGFARLASAARLAPIVGAFVAGMALAPAAPRDELQRRLAPIGHVLIPIFFLQIGIDTRLRAFTEPRVLRIAAVLCAVAIAGKLVAGLGVARGRANRLVVGIGMVPRGEVGLIFAGLGLSRGVLDGPSYAVLVLVVLVTTLVAPPWLRARVRRARRDAVARHVASIEPAGGWLVTDGGSVDLAAEPPVSLAPRLALDAAILSGERQPGTRLLEWLSRAEDGPFVWDEEARARLFSLLRDGTPRAWRVLEVTGMLRRLLPEVDAALRDSGRDPFDLDPLGALRWGVLEDLRALSRDPGRPGTTVWQRLERRDAVLLAGLATSIFEGRRDASARAEGLAAAIGMDPDDAGLVSWLVAERRTLGAAAARAEMSREDAVLDLASHVGSPQRADALYLLTLAQGSRERWEQERIDELFELIRAALAHPELAGTAAMDLVEQRREAAVRALARFPEAEVRRHLRAAPRRYLLATTPETIARHIRMLETPPVRGEVRLHAEPGTTEGGWVVHVALLDQAGVLAAIAGALAAGGISIEEASVSTWNDGVAIDVFRVTTLGDVDWDQVRGAIEEGIRHPSLDDVSPVEGTVDVDNLASPWYTIVELRARDRAGLLHRVASAFARAGVQIHSAAVATVNGIAVDTFGVTAADGAKLDASGEARLLGALGGSEPRRRRRSLRSTLSRR